MLSRGNLQSDIQRIGIDRDIGLRLVEVLHKNDVSIFENTSVVSYNAPASRSELVEVHLSSTDDKVPTFLIRVNALTLQKQPKKIDLNLEPIFPAFLSPFQGLFQGFLLYLKAF